MAINKMLTINTISVYFHIAGTTISVSVCVTSLYHVSVFDIIDIRCITLIQIFEIL